MKTRIRLSKILVMLLLPALWINASEAMKIEVGGTGRVSGCIRNAASNQPLGYASVTLFSVTDSSMIAGTISNSDGSFIISMLATGDYYLEISDSGYEQKQITGINIEPVHPRIDIGEVQIQPATRSGSGYSFRKLQNKKP